MMDELLSGVRALPSLLCKVGYPQESVGKKKDPPAVAIAVVLYMSLFCFASHPGHTSFPCVFSSSCPCASGARLRFGGAPVRRAARLGAATAQGSESGRSVHVHVAPAAQRTRRLATTLNRPEPCRTSTSAMGDVSSSLAALAGQADVRLLAGVTTCAAGLAVWPSPLHANIIPAPMRLSAARMHAGLCLLPKQGRCHAAGRRRPHSHGRELSQCQCWHRWQWQWDGSSQRSARQGCAASRQR